MMSDAIAVRITAKEFDEVSAADVLNLIEAVTVIGQSSTQMNKAVVRLLNEQMNSEVALFAASFLSDFDLKVGKGLNAKLME